MDYSRHLLIDAYNVIHQWPELRRTLGRGSAACREALAAAVRVLHDHERVRVTLVFDGRGDEIEVERPGKVLTFSYVYSSSFMSADDVIERMVGGAPDAKIYLVVTGDLAERHTVEALGASVLSPRDLHAWVAAAEKAVAAKLKTHRRRIESDWNNRLSFD